MNIPLYQRKVYHRFMSVLCQFGFFVKSIGRTIWLEFYIPYKIKAFKGAMYL